MFFYNGCSCHIHSSLLTWFDASSFEQRGSGKRVCLSRVAPVWSKMKEGYRTPPPGRGYLVKKKIPQCLLNMFFIFTADLPKKKKCKSRFEVQSKSLDLPYIQSLASPSRLSAFVILWHPVQTVDDWEGRLKLSWFCFWLCLNSDPVLQTLSANQTRSLPSLLDLWEVSLNHQLLAVNWSDWIPEDSVTAVYT